MIVLEAAKAMCNMEGLSTKDITQAVTALQTFLTNPKTVNKFAAIRVLNKLANKHPVVVGICNTDMEALILDSNRNIATLAITTLLKVIFLVLITFCTDWQ